MVSCTNRIARRVALSTTFVVLLILACRKAADDAAIGEGFVPAWSVQLHAHGSFSEGLGSIDSHSFEAQSLGVDAIWWSDHDFRITSYKHVDHFGFEGLSEPIDANETWSVELRRHADDTKMINVMTAYPGSTASFVPDATQGAYSLRLRTQHDGDEFRTFPCVLSASRTIDRRPLAGGVTIRAAIRPLTIDENARAYVRFVVSEHAPREGLSMKPYSVRYYLSETDEEAYRDGTTYHVPLAFESGEWNRLEFPLSRDVERGFPFIVARDNALYRIIVGVEARGGATAEAAFDDLVIEHTRRGHDMFALQSEVLDEVGELYPDVRQLQGVEVSFASRHLNEFSRRTDLLDYDAITAATPPDPKDDRMLDEAAFRREVTRAAVAACHERGGLISYNHLFGVALENSPMRRSRREQLSRLVRNQVFGVDILEVGYRDRGGASLDDHLWVWDRLALAGFRLVGTGVSDTHGGPEERWSGRPNNFVSWIYGAEPTKADFLGGLAAGRVFFGDIELWDGTLDLVTARGFRMGQELVTDRATLEIEALVTGHDAGDELVFVVRGEEVSRHALAAGDERVAITLTRPAVDAADGVGTFVRVYLASADGGVEVLSNPIYVLGAEEATGLRSARAAIDLAGVRSLSIEGFEIAGVGRTNEGGRAGFVLRGLVGAEATLTFDVSDCPGQTVRDVRLKGIEGEWSVEDGVLRIRAVKGIGTLEIVP